MCGCVWWRGPCKVPALTRRYLWVRLFFAETFLVFVSRASSTILLVRSAEWLFWRRSALRRQASLWFTCMGPWRRQDFLHGGPNEIFKVEGEQLENVSELTFKSVRIESDSEWLYDRRFSANRFVLATSPLRITASNSVFQLNTYVTSSLTRGRVCRLQLLLVLASAIILWFDSLGTDDHILLCYIRDTPNLEGQVPCLYPPGTGWPGYTPRHRVPFSSSPMTCG
jgi:hypothetical protein